MEQYEIDLSLNNETLNFPTYKISIEYRDDIFLREHTIRNKDETNWNKYLENQKKWS